MGCTLLHAPCAAGRRASRESPLPRAWQAGSKENSRVPKKNQLTSNFCLSSSFPSSPSGGTGTLKYSPSSWLSSLNLEGHSEKGRSGRQERPQAAGLHLPLQAQLCLCWTGTQVTLPHD